MLSEFNTLLPRQKFTSELEENGKKNFQVFNVMKLQNSETPQSTGSPLTQIV